MMLLILRNLRQLMVQMIQFLALKFLMLAMICLTCPAKLSGVVVKATIKYGLQLTLDQISTYLETKVMTKSTQRLYQEQEILPISMEEVGKMNSIWTTGPVKVQTMMVMVVSMPDKGPMSFTVTLNMMTKTEILIFGVKMIPSSLTSMQRKIKLWTLMPSWVMVMTRCP